MMVKSELYAKKRRREHTHLMHEEAVAVVDTIFDAIMA
jgi:hypothetical protein